MASRKPNAKNESDKKKTTMMLHENRMTERNEEESGTDSISLQEYDVLSGRGGLANKHPGNLIFRRVVHQNKELYQKCTKSHKYFLAISIIAAIERQGGRFVKRDQVAKRWIKISRKEAFAKTLQALREQDDKSKKPSDNPERVLQRLKEQRREGGQKRPVADQQQPVADRFSETKGTPQAPSRQVHHAFPQCDLQGQSQPQATHHAPLPTYMQPYDRTWSNRPFSEEQGIKRNFSQQLQPLRPSAPIGQNSGLQHSSFNIILKADVGIPYDDDIFNRKLTFDEDPIINDVEDLSTESSDSDVSNKDDIFGPRPARVQRVSSGQERLVLFPNELDDILLKNDTLEGLVAQDASRRGTQKAFKTT